jgi:hypothetical protein
VEGLSDVLRVEMSEFDVSVSVIEPAYVATTIFSKITKVPHSATVASWMKSPLTLCRIQYAPSLSIFWFDYESPIHGRCEYSSCLCLVLLLPSQAIDEEVEVSEEIKAVYGYHFRPAKRVRDRRMVRDG